MTTLVKDEHGLLCYPEDLNRPPKSFAENVAEIMAADDARRHALAKAYAMHYAAGRNIPKKRRPKET